MGKNYIRVILLKHQTFWKQFLLYEPFHFWTFLMFASFFIDKEDIYILFPLCLTFPSRKLKKNTFVFNKNSKNDTMPSLLYAKCIQFFLILFRSNPFFVLCAFPWKAFSLSVSSSKSGTRMTYGQQGKRWLVDYYESVTSCHCSSLSMQPKVELDFR